MWKLVNDENLLTEFKLIFLVKIQLTDLVKIWAFQKSRMQPEYFKF